MLPKECINAFDAPFIPAGLVSLRPLTLGDVVVLESAGISLTEDLTVGNALMVANLLIADSFKLPWKFRIRCTLKQRLNAVSKALQTAFNALVPSQRCAKVESLMPTGYGWPLEMVEMMMHEYHMCFEEASQVPLARAFALAACARVRKGGKPGGPDYFERVTMKELKHG